MAVYCHVLGHYGLLRLGASLHVTLELPSPHSGGSMEDPFQEEQLPLLFSCNTPPGAVFAQPIKVELPSQGLVDDLL